MDTNKVNEIYGRLKESVHITGYSMERACIGLENLLEDDNWKIVGTGFDNIRDFLKTINLSQFKIAVDKRKKLAKKLNQIEASQRSIAKALGVDHATILHDLKGGENSPPEKKNINENEQLEKENGENSPPAEISGKTGEAEEPTPLDPLDIAPDKVVKNTEKKIKAEENREARRKRETEEIIKKSSSPAKVIQSDCLQILDSINPIDLLIADPPYFTEGDFTGHISKCLQKVKSTGQAYIFMSSDPKELFAYLSMDLHQIVLEQILVWNYNNTGQRQPNRRYISNYQVYFYYRGANAPNVNKPVDGKHQYACQTVNAPDARIGNRYFKWQKPIELIERLIQNSSKEGDFVFDPFVGTGTTVLSAAKLGRKNLGCDINPERIAECVQRGCQVEQLI